MMELASAFATATLVVGEIRRMKYNDWNDIFDVFVSGLLESGLIHTLTKIHRLGIAIVIVGAKKLEYFDIAFRALCEWEKFGGPYWIMQEEILRHYIIYVVEHALVTTFPSKKQFRNEVECKIHKIIPDPLPKYIQNVMLSKKIVLLKVEIACLMERMKKTDDPDDILQEYKGQFPLTAFTTLYVDWTRKLLHQITPDNNLQHILLSSFCTSNDSPFVTANTNIPQHQGTNRISGMNTAMLVSTLAQVNTSQHASLPIKTHDNHPTVSSHYIQGVKSPNMDTSTSNSTLTTTPYHQYKLKMISDKIVHFSNNDTVISSISYEDSSSKELSTKKLLDTPKITTESVDKHYNHDSHDNRKEGRENMKETDDDDDVVIHDMYIDRLIAPFQTQSSSSAAAATPYVTHTRQDTAAVASAVKLSSDSSSSSDNSYNHSSSDSSDHNSSNDNNDNDDDDDDKENEGEEKSDNTEYDEDDDVDYMKQSIQYTDVQSSRKRPFHPNNLPYSTTSIMPNDPSKILQTTNHTNTTSDTTATTTADMNIMTPYHTSTTTTTNNNNYTNNNNNSGNQIPKIGPYHIYPHRIIHPVSIVTPPITKMMIKSMMNHQSDNIHNIPYINNGSDSYSHIHVNKKFKPDTCMSIDLTSSIQPHKLENIFNLDFIHTQIDTTISNINDDNTPIATKVSSDYKSNMTIFHPATECIQHTYHQDNNVTINTDTDIDQHQSSCSQESFNSIVSSSASSQSTISQIVSATSESESQQTVESTLTSNSSHTSSSSSSSNSSTSSTLSYTRHDPTAPNALFKVIGSCLWKYVTYQQSTYSTLGHPKDM